LEFLMNAMSTVEKDAVISCLALWHIWAWEADGKDPAEVLDQIMNGLLERAAGQ
jgi:hypothetical protein